MPTGGALKSTSDQSFEPAADNGTLHQSSGAEKLRDSSKPVQGADETPVAPLQKAANTEQGIRSTASVVLAPVQIDCFEHFDVRFSGNAADLSQLRPKARSVLYYLACHHERLVPEESLIGALWPDMEISSARHNLQVAVSAVRRLLAPTASVGRNEILRREGRCYVLSLPPGSEVDVQGFERALDACRTTRTISSTSEIAGHLRTALSLYKGQRGLIPEAGTAEWILPLRDQYAYEVQQAALQLAEIEIKSGAYPAALALTKRVLHRDPYNDAGWRTLIKTHETAGDRAEAARAQRAYQLLLESVADSSRANSA
ncbi:AfsR/SARP family transcriptional regulator [Streptomyces chartreusis]